MRLPLPPLMADTLAFAGAHEDPGRERVDRRMYGWTSDVPPPTAEGQCHGLQRETFTLHFFDRCWMQLRRKAADPHDPESRPVWELRVQHKARETYGDGPNLWQVRWLGLMSWILLGRWLRPSELHAAGWSVSRLDLNSDFINLRVATQDVGNFMTTATPRVLDKMLSDMHVSRRDPYWGETVQLGKETSDVCCKCYQKSTQLRDAKRIEPEDSMYAPLWRAHGWDGRADVTRVEWRLTKKGLIYTDPESGDIVLDMRDPAALLSPEKLRYLWEYLCTRRRLTVDDATRKTRRSTDPAWVEVIRLGAERPRPPDMRQVPRWVRAMTQRERLAKWMFQSALGAIGYMAGHGTRPESWTDVGLAMQAMGRQLVDQAEHAETPDVFSPLPTLRSVDRIADYSQLAAVFFAGEAAALRDEFLEQVGRYMPPVDWDRVPITKPPDERKKRNTS